MLTLPDEWTTVSQTTKFWSTQGCNIFFLTWQQNKDTFYKIKELADNKMYTKKRVKDLTQPRNTILSISKS